MKITLHMTDGRRLDASIHGTHMITGGGSEPDPSVICPHCDDADPMDGIAFVGVGQYHVDQRDSELSVLSPHAMCDRCGGRLGLLRADGEMEEITAILYRAIGREYPSFRGWEVAR